MATNRFIEAIDQYSANDLDGFWKVGGGVDSEDLTYASAQAEADYRLGYPKDYGPRHWHGSKWFSQAHHLFLKFPTRDKWEAFKKDHDIQTKGDALFRSGVASREKAYPGRVYRERLTNAIIQNVVVQQRLATSSSLSTEEAIKNDPDLDAAKKKILLSLYRELRGLVTPRG